MPTPLLDNRQLGPDVQRPNLLTNGGFEIWQRGNGPFTGDNTYSADKWRLNYAGTASVSGVSKTTTLNDVASIAALQIAVQGADGGTTNYVQLGNKPFDDGGIQLRGKSLSLSVRVRVQSGTTPFHFTIYEGQWQMDPTVQTATTNYQTFTFTWTHPVSAADLWVGVAFTGNATYLLDNASLVVGSQPADYVPLHPADDLARCLRYYEVVGAAADANTIYTGYAAVAASGWYITHPFAMPKAVVPTVTRNGTWTVQNSSQLTPQAAGTSGLRVSFSSSGAGLFYVQNSGAGQNITAEANP